MKYAYKHSNTFANRKYEELSYPKKSENVRPHYSQFNRENATLSRGTSPLASYKEVPPPPLGLMVKGPGNSSSSD